MQKDFAGWNERTTAALAGGGCRGDVCNNGRRITVYLHARNRFSFYFCANMRPIACERSFPRLGRRLSVLIGTCRRLAQNAVYRLMSRDVNRQLVGVGWFSLFTAACLRKFIVPRNRPTRSFQLSDVPYSPERECFSQTIISNTTTHLSRMITLPACESSKTVDKQKRGGEAAALLLVFPLILSTFYLIPNTNHAAVIGASPTPPSPTASSATPPLTATL